MRIAFGTVLVGLALLPGMGVGQGPTTKGGAAKTVPGKNPPSTEGPKTWGGKTLHQWMGDIKHADASKRTMALLALINFPDEASSAVPLILDRLSDTDVSVRVKAAMVLRLIRIESSDVPNVVKALANRLYPPGTNQYYSESQAVVRYEAAKALTRFMADAAPAIPALVQGTKDSGCWEVRHSCISLLWRAAVDRKAHPDERAVKALLDALRNGRRLTYQEKLEIFQGLAIMGKPSNQQLLAYEINQLALAAGSTGLERKPLVIWTYAGLAVLTDGPTAAKAIHNITKYLSDPKEALEVRAQAAHALGAVGPLAKSKVPILLKMLEDKEAVVVNGACLALTHIADKSDSVIDGLLVVLNDKDPQRAGAAVKALWDLKIDAPRVTKAMDKLLDNKKLDRNLRYWVEEALKELQKQKK